jgi:hypothetical protein
MHIHHISSKISPRLVLKLRRVESNFLVISSLVMIFSIEHNKTEK